MLGDRRQRAPFVHQSSSADLAGQASAARSRLPLTSPTERHPLSGAPGGPSAAYAHGHGGASGSGAGAGAAGGSYFPRTRAERKGSEDLSSHEPIAHSLLSPGYAGYPGAPYTSSFSLNTPPIARRLSLDTLPSTLHPLPLRLRVTPHVRQTAKFVGLCALWYSSSAVSSNTTKVILNSFNFHITLTFVQFAFVAGLCWLGSRRALGWTGRLRRPTWSIVKTTLPVAGFQVLGHMFSTFSISRVPVSTVHTIKALSPLFTVLAYAFLFRVSYSPATYLSLLPLTLGVMLACSLDFSASNLLGLFSAFGSTMVFVSQNIFFKKIMPSPSPSAASTSTLSDARLDKINLLYFSSSMAFLMMLPIWLYTDAPRLVALYVSTVPRTTAASTVSINFVINGTVHFAQNLLAFAILSSTSPVTYSIAGLVKRIVVICISIVWFQQPTHAVQAAGIALTALGLWMYNGAKRDVERGEKRVRQVEASRDGVLPSTVADQRVLEGRASPSPGQSMPPGQLEHEGLGFLIQQPVHAIAPLAYDKPPGPPPYAHPGPPGYAFPPAAISAPPAAPVPMPTPMPAHDPYAPRYDKARTAAEPYPSPPASTASSPPGHPLGLARADEVQPIALTA
ncbi:hypothetical protein Q5752_004360 [Cryptotrichosporon argae]